MTDLSRFFRDLSDLLGLPSGAIYQGVQKMGDNKIGFVFSTQTDREDSTVLSWGASAADGDSDSDVESEIETDSETRISVPQPDRGKVS